MSNTYNERLLNLAITLKNDCAFKYYYKFKGKFTQGYLWNGNVETEIYEHWVQQTCTVDFKVEVRRVTGTASVTVPPLPIFSVGLTFAGVGVTAQVDVQISVALTASLTYTGTDSMYVGGRVTQMVKVGCRGQCTNDIIFERSFEPQNQNNFDAVDNVGGSLAPLVSFVLSAGIMGSGGMFGGWGFKLSAGVKLSLPLSMQTGTVPAVANPNRFYLHLGNRRQTVWSPLREETRIALNLILLARR